MTVQESARIIRTIAGTYPNWNVEKEFAIKLWAQLFSEVSFEEVAGAVKAYMLNDRTGFAPVPGQINSLIQDTRNQDLMNEGEAWQIVRKAISNGLYGADTEFKALPPILQRVVGDPDQLTRWASLTDGLDTVVMSNVQRAYRQELEREKFNRAVPSDIRMVLAGTVYQRLEGETR